MQQWLESITLESECVRLVPLEASHKDAMLEAAADGKLWQLWFTSVPSARTIDDYIAAAMDAKAKAHAMPFVVIDKQTGTVIGSTRFCNADSHNRRVEIGYTWYAKRYQRTKYNTECKYLLLKYAFENLDCIAVEFRTHWHNGASRAAISRLGAKQDGILRNHQIGVDGEFRDTVVFSIIASEWAVVKKALMHKLSS